MVMLNNVAMYIPLSLTSDERNYLTYVSSRYHLSISKEQPRCLALVWENQSLYLKDFQEPKINGVNVDFLSGSSLYRKQFGGGFKEPIAKAVGVKGNQLVSVVDATPGLGRDAFVLVGLGCKVTLIERSPVVAALLHDGIRRLSGENPECAERINLIHGNSIDIMRKEQLSDVDVVYLDPMFPHKKKSALVKKEMRVFQQLLGADGDQSDLLAPALDIAKKRVVVKRPNSAEFLANKKPSMSISSKKHRFDVHLKIINHD